VGARETARKRDPATLTQLTPMERQLAQLVSQGISNKDVAARPSAAGGFAAPDGIPAADVTGTDKRDAGSPDGDDARDPAMERPRSG
jgi:hypothetical protein